MLLTCILLLHIFHHIQDNTHTNSLGLGFGRCLPLVRWISLARFGKLSDESAWATQGSVGKSLLGSSLSLLFRQFFA